MKTGTTHTYAADSIVYDNGASSSTTSAASTRTISQISSNGDRHSPTPYNLYVEETTSFSGRYRHYDGEGHDSTSYTRTGNFGLQPTDILSYGPSETDAYAACLDKLYGKIRGNLDLAIDIAEFKQTKRMLTTLEGSGIKAIADLFNAMSNKGLTFQDFSGQSLTKLASDAGYRNWKLARTWSDEVRAAKLALFAAADLWLMWQYGVRPLLQDIHDVVTLLTTDLAPGVSRIETKVSLPFPPSAKRYAGTQPYGGGAQEVINFNGKSKTGCIIKVDYTTPTDVNQLAKFTSLNPASIIWEATTYSFVADWFFDIGGFLRQIESNYLYRTLISNVMVTKLTAAEAVVECEHQNSYSNGRLYYMKTSANKKQIRITRTVGSQLPTPMRPRINANLGASRMLSAAALLVQLLK